MRLSSSFVRGLFCSAALIVTLSTAKAFEGRIHMDMTSGKKHEKTSIDYAMKDGKMRMDPQSEGSRGGSTGIIVDMKAQEMIILMDHDGRRMFMRRPMGQGAPQARGRASETAAMSAPPVATGRTEKIAGYPATEYTAAGEKGETVELWLAEGLGPFMSFSGGSPMMGRGAQTARPTWWEGFVRDGGAFPMRVVTRDAKGVEQSRMEVTKIDKTSLPDSLFSTEGYSEFQMPGFGGGFNPFGR